MHAISDATKHSWSAVDVEIYTGVSTNLDNRQCIAALFVAANITTVPNINGRPAVLQRLHSFCSTTEHSHSREEHQWFKDYSAVAMRVRT